MASPIGGRASPAGMRHRSTPTPTGDREAAGSPNTENGTPRNRPKTTEHARTMPTPSFQTCMDYSKLNEQLHNGHRNDTFSTPSSLNARYHIATGRRKGLSDTEYLVDVCEQAFAKNLRDIRSAQEEMRQSIDSIRRDLNDTVEEQNARGKLLVDLMEVTEDIHQAFSRPIVVELSSVQEELQKVMSSALQGQNMMQGLEDRLSQKMTQVLDNLETAQTRQEQFHGQHLVQIKKELESVRLKDMQDAIARSENQLSRVVKTTQSLSIDSAEAIKGVTELHDKSRSRHAQTTKDVLQLQETNRQHQTDLFAFVEIQFGKHVRENPVNVDFSDVMQQILKTQYVVETDFDQLLNEISKIQQALNTDFARVVAHEAHEMAMPRFSVAAKALGDKSSRHLTITDEEEPAAELKPCLKRSTLHDDLEAEEHAHESILEKVKRGTKIFGKRERVRVRDFWTQTETAELVEIWCQTDDYLMPSKKDSKKKKRFREPNTELVAAPIPTHVKSQAGPKNVFGDAQAMKAKVRANLMQPQYDVSDMYHTKGCFQAIARSSLFENFNFFVIFLNAIWIAVDTDLNDEPLLIHADPVFQVAENAFCAYFTFELFIRFMAFKYKSSCLHDKWFVFDSLLVFFMVIETWIFTIVIVALDWKNNQTSILRDTSILRVARLVKIIRMTRMAKLLRAIPELVVLVRGLVIAFRTVIVFVLLWLLLIFVFAVLFRQLTDGQEVGNRYFKTVPAAMNTLLLNGLVPEIETFVRDLGDNIVYYLLIMAFVILASLTIMHMLVGVLVELVGAISVAEKEGMTVSFISSELRRAMVVLDVDLQSRLSKLQFQKLLLEPAISSVIQAAGVDVLSLVDMSDVIFEDLEAEEVGGLSFENLVEIVLNMRGTNTATVKDVKANTKIVKTILKESTDKMLEDVRNEFKSVKTKLSELTEAHQRAYESRSDDEDSDRDESQASEELGRVGRLADQELPGRVEENDLT